MSKIYLTKTGIELKLIQGGLEGPSPKGRAKLSLVTPELAENLERERQFIAKRDASKIRKMRQPKRGA